MLRRENKAPRTIEVYLASAHALLDWLIENDRPVDVTEITRCQIGDWSPT